MSHKLYLKEEERRELEHILNHHEKPYMRERASALLKKADGMPAYKIAQSGLLKKRCRQAVSGWIKAFKESGLCSLGIKQGRGRKPSFFPSGHQQSQS